MTPPAKYASPDFPKTDNTDRLSLIAIAFLAGCGLAGCKMATSDKSPATAPPLSAPTQEFPAQAPAPAPSMSPTVAAQARAEERPMLTTASPPRLTTASPTKAMPEQPRRALLRRSPVSIEPGGGKPMPDLDQYSVVVSADKVIQIPGPPGEMRVWIGNPEFKPATAEGMRAGETTIPALSNTAKVTPFAPGMEVLPKESVCERIDPSGSEVRFQLKPQGRGSYKVGADVAMYASADCSGQPIPKAASTVEVEVSVDSAAIKEQHRDALAAASWESLLGFWKEALALISALLLFLIRKQLSQWFGFTPKT